MKKPTYSKLERDRDFFDNLAFVFFVLFFFSLVGLIISLNNYKSIKGENSALKEQINLSKINDFSVWVNSNGEWHYFAVSKEKVYYKDGLKFDVNCSEYSFLNNITLSQEGVTKAYLCEVLP